MYNSKDNLNNLEYTEGMLDKSNDEYVQALTMMRG
jgi:hypothetical protein